MNLARFTVPASGGTIDLGALIISVVFDFANVIQGWRSDAGEYVIRSCRVVDDREQRLSQLRERFLVLPEPLVTGLMHGEEAREPTPFWLLGSGLLVLIDGGPRAEGFAFVRLRPKADVRR